MRYIIAIWTLCCFMQVSAQQKFDYSDIKSGRFSVRSVQGVRSMADGEHYTVMNKCGIIKFSYRSGTAVDTLYNAAKCVAIGSDFSDYQLSADERKILLTTHSKPIYRRSFKADYWVYDIALERATRLSEQGGEQVACFCPDANRVAFVRDNNIWLADLLESKVRQITTDGVSNKTINGHTDWTYEEEFGFTRAFEFSPDGTKIAFLRFDESRVPEFTMMRFDGGLYPKPYTYKYPKAGESNSEVEVRIFDISSGQTITVPAGAQTDQYIPRFGWSPAGDLYFFRTNRLQNQFDLQLYCVGSMKVKTIYTEQNERYIERLDDQTVTFLPDGDRFVVLNEVSGFKHLYLYSIKKGLLNAVTRGDWDVTQLVAVADKRLYYLSCEGSPLRRNLYSVSLNGENKRRLTTDPGVYTIAPSHGMRYFISYFSNASTPLRVTLHRADGTLLRTLESNQKLRQRIGEVQLPVREFFTFTTPQGISLNGYMLKPHDFDPSKKYPVLMSQYSGPGSQEVLDKWAIGWCDVLVQRGYVVVSVDGRGTGCRGEAFRKCTYGNLGALEVEDQLSAARYIASQTWADASRIGIYGWSYGGFMSLSSILKGNDLFKMAIAVAPVTSWRFYDTIYTEIYNGLPQTNVSGYDDNSPINFADSLRGKLLIVHGTADDNVHIQNTYAMVDALIKADKKFDLMIYPDNNHSMRPSGRDHIMEMMIDYTLKNL